MESVEETDAYCAFSSHAVLPEPILALQTVRGSAAPSMGGKLFLQGSCVRLVTAPELCGWLSGDLDMRRRATPIFSWVTFVILLLSPAAPAAGAAAGTGQGWLPGFGNPISVPGTLGEPTCGLVFQNALIVAGQLDEICGTPVGVLARYDGASWTAYADGLGAPPQCLVEYQGELIAGGTFQSAGDQAASYVAAWNGTSWRGLGAGLSGGTGGGVSTLCVYNGELIAAGDFSTADGLSANCIARWDGTAWSPLGAGLGGRMDTQVFALAVFDGDLIAGGRFAWAGGQVIPFIARWDGASWLPLGSGVDETVRALAVVGESLIAGGDFVTAGGMAAAHVARWDGVSWGPMGNGLGVQAGGQTVNGFAEFEGDLFAGGSFADAVEPDVVNIARWDAGQGIWRSVGAGLDGRASFLTTFDGSLFVCGGFARAGAAPAQNIARWVGGWTALCSPPAGNGFDGSVHALAVFQGDVIAGGEFARAGGMDSPYITRLEDSTWQPVGTQGPTGPVQRLWAGSEALLAMGAFPMEGTPGFAAVGFWNLPNYPDTWQWSFLFDPNSPPNPPFTCSDQDVTAITYYRDRNYIGWHCADTGEMLIRAGLRHDSSPWFAVLGDQKRVNAFAIYRDRLIVGGSFLSVNGVSAKGVAAWNDTVWSALGEGIEPAQRSATVYCLAVIGDTLYAGGRFLQAGTHVVNNIARWDGERWLPMGAVPGCDGIVRAMANVHGNLIVAGDFRHAGGAEARSIAQWDGHSWSPLGSGIEGFVESLAFDGTTLYAGGSFLLAGGLPSHYIAAWTPEIQSETCAFPKLTEGEERVRAIPLRNPSDDAVTLTLMGGPEISPFSFPASFIDSLQAGIPMAPHSAIQARVLFTPAGPGAFERRLRFLLSPIGREISVDVSGSARELEMTWTSRELYEPLFHIAGGDSVYVEMTLPESVTVERMDLSFREGGARGYERMAMPRWSGEGSADRYASYVPARMTGARGLEFYVKAANGLVTKQIGDSLSPIRMRVDLPDLVFPETQPAESYRLISVPLQLPDAWIKVVLGDNLGESDPTRWRMFSYDPDTSRYRDLSAGEEVLRQGQGYWLISRNEVTLDTGPIGGTSTPNDSSYAMAIAPGWNLIGNPFAFPVPWDSVEVVAGRSLVERPVAWNGQEYAPDVSVLSPFVGYWLYNQAAGPITLRIPPREATTIDKGGQILREGESLRGAPQNAEGEWTIRIGAAVPRRLDSYNYAGMRRGARDGVDPQDRTEPPFSPGDAISLYFPSPGNVGGCRRLSTDMRGPIDARVSDPDAGLDSVGLCWPFDVAKTFVAGNEGDRVTLSFEMTGDLPADLSALVLDRDLGKRIVPTAGETYDFDLGVRDYVRDPASSRFVLLVGSREFIEEEGAGQIALPVATRLYPPSSNPCRGAMTIRFDLAATARIQIGIYDPSGARVRTLWDGERPAGHNQLTWDGRGDRGRPLASGTYFIRLEAGAAAQTRKIVLIH